MNLQKHTYSPLYFNWLKKIFLVLALTVLVSSNTYSQDWKKIFEDNEKKIVRLPPDSLIGLPRNIIKYLIDKKYDIPKCHSSSRSFCKGDFIIKGKTDWAVAASQNFRTRIIVFHEGKTDSAHVYEFGQKEDIAYIIATSLDKDNPGLVFARYIRKASVKDIHKAQTEIIDNTTLKLPKIDHAGIEDIFEKRRSEIHYYYDGKWISITSGDFYPKKVM
jgi:hypothetical protein